MIFWMSNRREDRLLEVWERKEQAVETLRKLENLKFSVFLHEADKKVVGILVDEAFKKAEKLWAEILQILNERSCL